MTEKVFKVFLARLEESAYYYGIHKNDAWKEQLEKSRKKLLETFQKQQKLISELYGVSNKLDMAYLASIQYGETMFTGEEYDKLNDVLVEVETLLNIK